MPSTTSKMMPSQTKEPDPVKTSETAIKLASTFLEDDDEFEDFPIEGWTQEEAEEPEGKDHLWEASWDDEDESQESSKELGKELSKEQGRIRRS